MIETFDYQLFGLRIRSELLLPELFEAEGDAGPDVSIRRGAIPFLSADAGLQAQGDALMLTIPDVARYRIEGGREILVDSTDGAPERNVRLYLLGSAFGALLHQRGLLPLHANAIEIDGRAVAFMGESGAGKSTLAAWFHDKGHRIIADDVCVVGFEDGKPHVEPGMPRLRLWEETLNATGRAKHEYARSYVGDDSWNKFDVPVAANAAADRRLPLCAIYELARGDDFDLRRSEGVEAVEAVFAHTYRGSFVAAATGTQRHWAACIQLARTSAIFRVVRPWNLEQLDVHNAHFLDHAMGCREQR